MIDKRVVFGGFAAGLALGMAALNVDFSALGRQELKAAYAATEPAAPRSSEEKAAFRRAVALVRAGKHDEALGVIRNQALAGHRSAQSMVGAMYMHGKGVPEDPEEAIRWFRLAAEQGYPAALRQMGWSYATGDGVDFDAAEARRWFLRAAAAGDAQAQFMAGDMLIMGIGGEPNRQRGMYWLHRAAAGGDQLARAKLDQLSRDPAADLTAQVFADVAAANGGRISLRQMQAISGITSSMSGDVSRSGDSDLGWRNSPALPGAGGLSSGSRDYGAASSIDDAYGTGSASSRYTNSGPSRVGVDVGSPTILNPAGPGLYSDPSGDTYTQAGPHGVVNTRTGEFSPTN